MPELFKQWLHAFDAKVGSQNIKIALFMDHCPAHPAIGFLASQHHEYVTTIGSRFVLTYEASLSIHACESLVEKGGNWEGCNQMECT
jgi:hypothetical protein